MSAVKDTVYIKGNEAVEVTQQTVNLGDLIEMECSDPKILPRLKTIHVLKFSDPSKKYSYHGRSRTVVSVLKLIQCIHEVYPAVDVQNLGAQDIIVTWENQETAGGFLHWLKIVIVVLISFSGSAFSIMAFNNDVDVSKLFSQIYEWLTGQESNGYTMLEIGYSYTVSAESAWTAMSGALSS